MAAKGRADRLDSVIRIAEEAEQQAFADLAKCREEMAQQEEKLEDLQSYREEYHQGMRETGGSMGIQQVQNRYAFLQKLEVAIDGQQQQIVAWKEHEERLQQVWLEKRVRCRALNKASEQRREQLRREANRKEQKVADDLALNRK